MSVLRPLQQDDAEALAKQANCHEIWRNLRDNFPQPYTVEDAHQFLAGAMKPEQTIERFAIVHEGHFAGLVGIHRYENVHRFTGEIGYWIGEAFWGKGIASKAVEEMCAYVFERNLYIRIEGQVYDWNPASCRVLEKAGFKKEALLEKSVFKDGKLIDGLLYSKIHPNPTACL